jgi:hypothetical protein
MEEAGLVNTSFHPLTGGIATVYVGVKPEAGNGLSQVQ